jgi:hypothetical protein
MPVRALHGTLLRDGRVLLIAGSGNDPAAFAAGTFRSVVWDPADDSFLEVPTPEDLFCSGHVTLPDGRVLVSGGTTSFPGVDGAVSYLGGRFSYVFDPGTNRFSRTNDMQEGHWYPTLTKLETGDVWAAGGYSHRGDGASWNVEMFAQGSGAWLPASQVTQSGQDWGTYPHMFLLADGRMFYTGGHTFGSAKWNAPTGAQIHDWRSGAVGDIPGLRDKELRDQAGSVLLPPAQNQTFLIVGGGSTDNGGATNRADIVNMNQASPRYVPAADLPGPGRQYLNLTTLPNRTVLASNGGSTPRGGNVLDAAVFSPSTGSWTRVAADPVGRNYHSAALLLPDGQVAVFGSNPADNSFELRISVYTPSYAQPGVTRPAITAVSTGEQAGYGEAFDLAVSGPVVAASLTSPGSSTHQTDTNMRLVDLPITGTGTTRRATVPTNPALLPPGPYMLTVLTADGTPSTARWITIR